VAETVLVRYFAAAEEATGCAEERVALEPPTLGALREALEARYGEQISRVLRSGSFLVDSVVSRDPERRITATVDVLPPFAGG
jgi:molybdopterin synthase sulfur carrier subunit